MTQLNCTITPGDDGTIHASSDELTASILPDGESKAFNRVFNQATMFGGKLHARLNNIAARIQQDKITEDEAWLEVANMIEAKNAPKQERWLILELDGVRCYIANGGKNIIMTKQDLYK